MLDKQSPVWLHYSTIEDGHGRGKLQLHQMSFPHVRDFARPFCGKFAVIFAARAADEIVGERVMGWIVASIGKSSPGSGILQSALTMWVAHSVRGWV